MKVLHVIPSVDELSGGPAAAIVPMCRALMQQGIEVTLATTDAGLKQHEANEHKGVPAKFFPAQLGDSFKYSRPLAAWLAANIRDFDLAHIHAVFNHSSVAAARVCRQAGIPYVVRPLGTLDPWSLAQKSLRKRVFWQLSGREMLRGAAAVHYTSEAEKLGTDRFTRMNGGKVIPLGIETRSATDPVTDFPRDPYVLVMSRLHPKKALDVLLDAFLALTDDARFADWRLVLAGDGPGDYVAKLKSKAAASPRVLFTGWVDGQKKEALLSRASLLALPSHQENFGLCVMEAMSQAVPVLVSPNVNLAPEIASVNAGWISAIDRNALIEKLAEALSDPEELAKRGRAGKQLSLQYSWENVARSLVDLYRSIL